MSMLLAQRAGLAPAGCQRPFTTAAPSALPRPSNASRRSSQLRAQSEADADAELEQRLAKLRQAKGATPYGEGAKAAKGPQAKKAEAPKAKAAEQKKPEYDYTGEVEYYSGPPHRGDLITNLALGTTLVWLPLTAAAVGRGAFVNYRFTDKRFSISTSAPWKKEQIDVPYQDVKGVVTVGRGIGLWGDMVVTLRDNSKVELRALDRFKELKDYVLSRRDALAPKNSKDIVIDLDSDEIPASGTGGRRGFS